MRFVMSNIARKASPLIDWKGRFWARRYSAEPVLDDDALVGRMAYILAHGVKEGLVRKCAEWPGLSCLQQLLDGSPRSFRWFNWTKRWSCRRPEGGPRAERFDSEWAEQEVLTVHPLPCWEHLPARSRRQRVIELTQIAEASAARERASVLGVAAVIEQDPHSQPVTSARSPRPACHAADPELRHEFRKARRRFVAAFRSAVRRWSAGDLDAYFPPFSFRPGGFVATCAGAG
jgi:hypothetical protein